MICVQERHGNAEVDIIQTRPTAMNRDPAARDKRSLNNNACLLMLITDRGIRQSHDYSDVVRPASSGFPSRSSLGRTR